MPFYTIKLVSTVDENGKPAPATDPGKKEIKQLNVWDHRSHAELHTAYARNQSLTLTRLGQQQSPGRPLEDRGEISVFFPFLVSIEDDIKHNLSQPGGPARFMARGSSEAVE